jgi:hypothetical protein
MKPDEAVCALEILVDVVSLDRARPERHQREEKEPIVGHGTPPDHRVVPGRQGPWRLSRDRANYDVVRLYVSKAAFVGKPLQAITLSDPCRDFARAPQRLGTDCLG